MAVCHASHRCWGAVVRSRRRSWRSMVWSATKTNKNMGRCTDSPAIQPLNTHVVAKLGCDGSTEEVLQVADEACTTQKRHDSSVGPHRHTHTATHAATHMHSHSHRHCTATQPHNCTATQPHSRTAAQPHSHTATQPHRHTQPHMQPHTCPVTATGTAQPHTHTHTCADLCDSLSTTTSASLQAGLLGALPVSAGNP